MMETSHKLIEIGAVTIEVMAVALIAGARYKLFLGRALSLGLEFLVAADVIRMVTIAPSVTTIGLLALVVMTRTFLSWSLVVEMEGRWPWQPASKSNPQVRV